MIDTVLTIVYAIIILLLLIFAHETGHLISAKMSGVKVNEFALGMGPKLFGFVKGETQYSLRAIPFGGFCAFEGEDDDSEDPRAFNNQTARVRAFVLFAGSVMNVLLAVVLISIIIFVVGYPTRVLASVGEDTPAYTDGLRAGDELLSINGTDVDKWEDVLPILTSVARSDPEGDPLLTITVLRKGEEKTIQTHFHKTEDGKTQFDIRPKAARDLLFFFKSFGYGARETVNITKLMYGVLGDLFTGKAGMDQLTGPVGIVVTVGEMARQGFLFLLQLTAFISLNLGIVNLLPFPALDGGRLVFLVIRKITGKAVTNEIEGRVHLIGIIVLFAFMAIITFQDIGRFFIR